MRPVIPAIALAALTWAGAAAAQTSAAPTAPTADAVARTESTPPAPANIRTTENLLDLCNTAQNEASYPARIGLCVGYFSGVLDYHLADTRGNRRTRKVCLPSAMPTRGEERADFVNWAQANRQYLDSPAVYGVMRFFISQYPCGQ